ncbi:MAG: glycosyltransferase family 2 protein [Parcubacteria group bacterium]|nr:glycosyltransferase family 2 protein [Parcubacteria group bacterium]
MAEKYKIYIGFITYGDLTAKYLPYFLPSLKQQSFKDFKILVIDNSEVENNNNASYIKNNFSEIDLTWAGDNLGFAKAFNIMIRRAIRQGAEYFLALNPDMILEPDVVVKLVNELDNNQALGSATAKILKWNFADQKKTNIIDSCGIKLLPGLRFVDCGQGEKDEADCNDEIIGPSGACAIYRLSALEKIKRVGQYFDELMFMYKEDCDLAYRLYLAGFKSNCVVSAVVYHDRSSAGRGENNLAVALNRKHKSRRVKQLSFLNQQIIFIKYWRLQNWREKINIIWFEIKMLVFALFFEPYLFKELINLSKISHKIIRYKNGN